MSGDKRLLALLFLLIGSALLYQVLEPTLLLTSLSRCGALGDGRLPWLAAQRVCSTAQQTADWARGHAEIEAFHHRFKDVLLIVNFNTMFYNNIPFLLELWSPLFPNIALFGPSTSFFAAHDDARGHVAGFDFFQASPDVLELTFDSGQRATIYSVGSSETGAFNYEMVAHAFRLFPDYKGYFLINDDVFLNWWYVSELDQRRFWFGRIPHHMSANTRDTWFWLPGPFGLEAYKRALAAMPRAARDRLAHNLAENGFIDARKQQPFPIKAMADVVYVPQERAAEFSELALLFAKQSVFLELAIPNILLALVESRRDVESLEGIYLWGTARTPAQLQACYDVNVPYVHPVKLSSARTRRVLNDWVRARLNDTTLRVFATLNDSLTVPVEACIEHGVERTKFSGD